MESKSAKPLSIHVKSLCRPMKQGRLMCWSAGVVSAAHLADCLGRCLSKGEKCPCSSSQCHGCWGRRFSEVSCYSSALLEIFNTWWSSKLLTMCVMMWHVCKVEVFLQDTVEIQLRPRLAKMFSKGWTCVVPPNWHFYLPGMYSVLTL